MQSRRLALMAATAIIAAISASAAGAATQPAIGVVDHNQILAEYTAYQDAEQQYDEFRAGRQIQLDEAANTVLLTDEEKTELENLKAVAVLTSSQKARMKELFDLTAARLKERSELNSLPTRDETQEARLKELTALLERRTKDLQTFKERLDKEIAAKADELMKPIKDKIDAALATVAKQMGLIAVLDKESVLYGGKDVTAKVLAELNKKP